MLKKTGMSFCTSSKSTIFFLLAQKAFFQMLIIYANIYIDFLVDWKWHWHIVIDDWWLLESWWSPVCGPSAPWPWPRSLPPSLRAPHPGSSACASSPSWGWSLWLITIMTMLMKVVNISYWCSCQCVRINHHHQLCHHWCLPSKSGNTFVSIYHWQWQRFFMHFEYQLCVNDHHHESH